MKTMDFIASQAHGMYTVVYLDRNGEDEYIFFPRLVDACQKARELVRMGAGTAIIIDPYRGGLLNRWGETNLMRVV